ncbi:dehydrogenase, Rv0697 family [Mycolicibacterium rhodesiae NBB3]|uniref:Dehydrogenase, Rv0697 family n=1 Tax=Mycolicibacterium rhodesiae (strain NBB3) TaxID=710685 RepID=G8RLG9_MYCRN|nr:mycofactocin system GMC family oxidoreductase MftG [Mycolicibacterium rhodesiae]AEV73601.1 dehydrogenase, Rv0697 family [Mycolicibacterium rhodesiae NBB3]
MIATHSDVLIIGAGSAGCVLAEQLSRDPACHITVLEQGPSLSDPQIAGLTKNGSVLPIGLGSPVARHYPTSLTTHPHRPVRLVRGAVVGGSGAVNGGYFCRAVPADFARWRLPGWDWSDVLEHYRAIETDRDFDGPMHGDSGPIPVQRCNDISQNAELFVHGAVEARYPWIADLNGEPAPEGFGPVPLNIVDGVRHGPGWGCIQPSLRRANLRLLTQTTARRVRLTASRAVGVQADSPHGAIELTADRIVLSAGSIGSAHLLMLSGIGDEDALRRAGVPVEVRLPVGQHCADHPEWVLSTTWGTEIDRPVLEVVLHTADNLEIRPYTGGFVSMIGDHRQGHPDWPHVGVALMQPRARGRVTLASDDPRVPPHIEHRYDSEPADVAALRQGAELVREICSAKTQLGQPMWSTSQHLCGTAPMGNDGDEHAVLDPQCRVRGIESLWVVDGSVMPTIPSRGPHATIAMVAQRAAEFVYAG